MKNIYLLAIGSLFINGAFAQPTLTESNSAPIIGESFDLNAYSWDGTEPTIGEDVTWDYTGITEGVLTTTSFVEKEECIAYSSYPDADIALTNDDVNYILYEYTNEGQFYHGFYAGALGVEIIYSNPETQMVYPMTYGTTNDDSFAGEFESGGLPFVRSGTTNVSAVGYGTLQLPDATIENVLLVKMVQDYNDVYAGGTIEYDVVVYQFLKPGWHYPFLTFNSIATDGGAPAYTGSFNSSESATVKTESTIQLSIYPNPVQDILTVQVEKPEDIQSISIYTIDGQLVYSENYFVDHINTSELTTGMYYIQIKAENETAIEKFVKQ